MKPGLSAMLAFSSLAGLAATGCSGGKSDPQAEAPPPLKVERVEDRNLFALLYIEKLDPSKKREMQFCIPASLGVRCAFREENDYWR